MNRLVLNSNLYRFLSNVKSSQCARSFAFASGSRKQLSAPKETQKTDLIEIFIDDKRLMVEKGITILEAATLAGVEIPRFCYHERLSVAGNCRMCLVEVEKSLKPVASCAMPVSMPGMRVKTNSDRSKQAREGVMELLLLNHPLDCPICDQGGECDLQDQSMTFGSDRSRLSITLDAKRAVEDKNIGPLVKTTMTRCIHCTRCVRFMNEIAGCDDLGTTGRGSDMQIGTYLENTVLLSELSGNIVDLCPVGALTSKPYAFTARPWELRRVDSIDVIDAVGSNIVVCTRAGDLLRILPRLNEDVNEEWLPDKSRHAPIDGLKSQRLTVPLLRPSKDSPLQQCDWEDALLTVGRALSNVNPARLEAIVGPMADAESMVALKDLLNSIGSENCYAYVDCDVDPGSMPTSQDLDFRYNYLFNTTISGLEDGVDLILLVGSNPRFEAPIINARIRKAWRSHLINDIALIGPPNLDLLYDYDYLGNSTKVLQDILNGKGKFAERLKTAKRPIIILGQQIVKNNYISNAYSLVQNICKKYSAELNILHTNASQVAAYDIGYKPLTERKVDKSGEPFILWLLGVDDNMLEIPSNCFVIYQGHNGDICANIADAVLPGAAFTEKQSTMVNLEGRVQQTLTAITPPVLAREDWKIIRACSEIANHTISYDNLLGIRKRMEQIAPHLNRHSSRRIEQPLFKTKLTPKYQNNKATTLEPKLRTLLDYYQTDSISRSSRTMGRCVVAVEEELAKRKKQSSIN